MRAADLVRYAEQVDETDPAVHRGLQRRTYGWIALGYLAFVGPLLFALAVGGTLMVVGIMHFQQWGPIPLIIASVVVAGGALPLLSLLSTVHSDEVQHPIKLRRYPDLEAVLVRIANQLSVPVPRRVCLTGEFNAGVRQDSRRALLGSRSRELSLGVPLLENLSAEQMESVLAHELAHLSRGDERASMSIYRMRDAWERRVAQWHHPAKRSLVAIGRWCVSRFLSWLWPRFNRDASILSRSCERFADSAAASCTSPTICRETLAKIGAISTMLQQELPYAQNDACLQCDQPTIQSLRVSQRLIEHTYNDPDRDQWMRLAAMRCDWHESTHPSLKERWLNLRGTVSELEQLRFPTPVAQSAAESWFGDGWQQVHESLYQNLIEQSRQQWAAHHRQLKQDTREVERLKSLRDPASTIQAAWMERDIAGPRQALETTTPLIDGAPSAPLQLLVGTCWADLADQRCEELLLPLLEAADERRAMAAGEALAQYYWTTGHKDRLVGVVDRCEMIQQAAFSAGGQSGGDFTTPQLSPEEREKLIAWLSKFERLQNAYLARRVGGDTSAVVQHVLCIEAKSPGIMDRKNANQRLQQAMLNDRAKPARMIICSPGGTYPRLAKRLRKRTEFRLVLPHKTT